MDAHHFIPEHRTEECDSEKRKQLQELIDKSNAVYHQKVEEAKAFRNEEQAKFPEMVRSGLAPTTAGTSTVVSYAPMPIIPGFSPSRRRQYPHTEQSYQGGSVHSPHCAETCPEMRNGETIAERDNQVTCPWCEKWCQKNKKKLSDRKGWRKMADVAQAPVAPASGTPQGQQQGVVPQESGQYGKQPDGTYKYVYRNASVLVDPNLNNIIVNVWVTGTDENAVQVGLNSATQIANNAATVYAKTIQMPVQLLNRLRHTLNGKYITVPFTFQANQTPQSGATQPGTGTAATSSWKVMADMAEGTSSGNIAYDAQFAHWQPWPGHESVPFYVVVKPGHPYDHSHVTPKTLDKLGLSYPPPPPEGGMA
jgi:hypothetical protein